jgi:hypothetical protein
MIMKREKQRARFVLCVRDNGSEELQRRKVYQVVPDTTASKEGYVRVVDESGEDYLYPADYFVPVRLARAVIEEFVSSPDTTLRPAAAHERPRRQPARGRGR